MFGQLLGQIDRAMLAAGAAERSRQALEAAALVVANAGVDQRFCILEVIVHALVLPQVVDHRSVLAGEGLETFFASGIGQAAGIEDKPAAVAGLIFWRAAAMEREAKNPCDKFVGRGSGQRLVRRGVATTSIN